VTRKVRVLDVSYNASNNELVCAMPAVRTLSSVCFVLLVLEVLLAATEGGDHRHGISTHTGAVVAASTVELAVAQPPARCPRPGHASVAGCPTLGCTKQPTNPQHTPQLAKTAKQNNTQQNTKRRHVHLACL
jgi:hypothetical protein